MTRLITLEAWIALNYAPECAPTIATARRWANAGFIYPKPQKQGRSYYVQAAARYTERSNEPPKLRLVDRLRAETT
jgi:hypothetical protein